MTTPPDIAKAYTNTLMRNVVLPTLPGDLGAIVVVFQCDVPGLVHFASTHLDPATIAVLSDLADKLRARLVEQKGPR